MTRPPLRRLLLALLTLMVVPAAAQDVSPLELSQQAYLRSDKLGVAFVAHTDNLGRDADVRYRQALELGAGWTRYPIYWRDVERNQARYTWDAYDRLVNADRAAGLKTNAILLGTPSFHGGQGRITGLDDPVFTDGTDTPGPGKQINPSNPWARFVFATVDRYRPGGRLAQAGGWQGAAGIRVWEMWNEPDFPWFWTNGQQDYARLLKVGYLAAKHADPNAQVMFGGLAYNNPDTNDWLRAVLQIYSTDATAPPNNWYMDIVAVHSYSDSRRSGLVVGRVKSTLADFGLERPVWLNEMGVPVWDDYPGPVWAADEPGARRLRATQGQQAAYLVQSAAYAYAAGADRIFWHQLYDDCGNEPGNHAPTDRTGGDAYGLYRNPAGYACYSQHPAPGTPRPAVEAFKATARAFGRGGFGNGRVQRRGDGSVFITFDRPTAGERITVMWSERPQTTPVSWSAESDVAQVYSYLQAPFQLRPTQANYALTLPPARPDDDPQRPSGGGITIGGATYIVIERDDSLSVASGEPALPGPATPRAQLPSQIGSVLGAGAAAPPSVGNPLDVDLTPPVTEMGQLPQISPATFTVRWNALDASGIERYLVWVRINEGEWQPWLETPRTESEYVGTSGNVYSFAVWAVDGAGNWSLNTDLQPQTFTVVE
jgi:YD repeat-containing protein